MYVSLGRAEPAPRVTTETPGPVRPFPIDRVRDTRTSEFGAVCRVLTKMEGGHSVGSGVLISPRHVLTCGHVIQPPQNANTRSITVFVAHNGPTDEKHGIKADGWAVQRGWNPHCCRSNDEDYGIIRLSKPVTTPHWPIAAFDPTRLMGKAGYLAGYPVLVADRDAHFMYRSRGVIEGSMSIDWCSGMELRWSRWRRIDDKTRLVWHLLDTRTAMSGGPMWSFIDNQRVVWGLHEGATDRTNKRAILFNTRVIEQIRLWVSQGLSARGNQRG
jgi:hypothetical protein